MELKFKNIRNVREFNHEFNNNRINFIYGPNGVGKSSIIKALSLKEDELKTQKSFQNWGEPEVSVDDEYEVHLFDEKNFNIDFIETEISSNIYELVFKTSDVAEIETDIESNLEDMKEIINTEEFQSAHKDLNDFLKMFDLNKDNTIRKTQTYRAVENFNPLDDKNIDDNHLLIYNNDDSKTSWLKWLNMVDESFIIDNRCPYCTSVMNDKIKSSIDNITTNTNVKDINNIIKANEQLLNVETVVNFNKSTFDHVLTGRGSLEAKTNQQNIKVELRKIIKLKSLFDDLTSFSKINYNQNYKQLNINNTKMHTQNPLYNQLNNLIETYNENVRVFNGKMRTINSRITRRVDSYNDIIKTFLKSIGVNYQIYFKKFDDKPIKLYIEYKDDDIKKTLDKLSTHLSFGEEKIITAMFFILYKSSNKKTVYLFDDPITLFDETKRYAFFNLLKYVKYDYRERTRIIKPKDCIIIMSHSFSALKESLTINNVDSCIAQNNEGHLTLSKVKRNDIITYHEKVTGLISRSDNELVKLILYRNLLYTEYLTDVYNRKYNYISSLSKLLKPSTKDKSHIFSQELNDEILKDINEDEVFGKGINIDREKLVENLKVGNILLYLTKDNIYWFEKVILFRVLIEYLNRINYESINEDKIIKRFITSLFHVETDDLMTISNLSIKSTPHYVLQLIDVILNKIIVDIENITIVEVDYENIL